MIKIKKEGLLPRARVLLSVQQALRAQHTAPRRRLKPQVTQMKPIGSSAWGPGFDP